MECFTKSEELHRGEKRGGKMAVQEKVQSDHRKLVERQRGLGLYVEKGVFLDFAFQADVRDGIDKLTRRTRL